jgi:hypothetical protein
MLIEFPIAWPLGKLLDCIFGKDHRTSTTRERGGRGGVSLCSIRVYVVCFEYYEATNLMCSNVSGR